MPVWWNRRSARPTAIPARRNTGTGAVSPRLKKLYVSAYQSSLFDRVLEKRINRLDSIEQGDLAFRHDNGACFLVEDQAAERERVKEFAISPSGPMFGCRMKLPQGHQLELEEGVLHGEGLSLESFNLPGGLRMEGERRPLRAPLGEPCVKGGGEGLVLEFSLPKGSYATSVLREVMKAD